MFRNMATRITAVTATVAMIAFGVVVLEAPAYAATTITVGTTVDGDANSACTNPVVTATVSPATLRNAICVANNIGGVVEISVPAGEYALTLGQLEVGTTSGSDITIRSISGVATIEADGTHRVMMLDPNLVGGVAVRLDGLTITGGDDNEFGGGGIIGGSYDAPVGDLLIVSNSSFVDNHANTDGTDATNRPGGGIQFIGGSLQISNSTFLGNSSGSSAGGAIAYQAMGAPGESLSIANSTFTGNNTVSVSTLANGGAGIVIDDVSGAATMAISDSQFITNTAVGTATAPAHGAGIWLRGGELTLTRSTFTGNALIGGTTAAGSAIDVGVDASLTAHYNRVVGNTGGSALYATATVDATNNWWGCSVDPSDPVCGTVTTLAPTNYTPWLALTATASPTDIPVGSVTTSVTASLLKNSAGTAIAVANLTAFESLPISWSDPAPDDSSVSPLAGTIVNGASSTTFTGSTTRGAATVKATLDNGSATASFGMLYAPRFTSTPATLFTVGTDGTFTVRTDAYHPAALYLVGTLPSGLIFTPAADGTATISGTPADGAGGVATFTLNAQNSAKPNASQPFTLTVHEAPEFTSAAAAAFVVGSEYDYVFVSVKTSGYPVSALSASSLPAGLTFVDNGDGTGRLSGTATAGTGGVYPITLSAVNTVATTPQAFILTLNEEPSVTVDPTATTVNAGDTASFTAEAGIGFPVPTVKWQVSTDNGFSFSDLPGETAATLSFAALQSQNGNLYRALFTNSVGSVASSAVALTVGTPPGFTSASSSTFRADGTAQTYTVTTSADPAAAITAGVGIPAWLSFTDNGDGSATLSGTPPLGSGGVHAFTLTAGNTFNPDASQAFTLIVDEAPVLTATGSAAFQVGTSGSATVTANPAGYPLTTTLTATGTLPAGLTFTDNGDGTATLSGTPLASSGGTYALTITAENSVGDSVQALSVTVSDAPQITSDPAAQRVIAGGDATFITSATGYPAPTVQWQVSTDGGTAYSDVADATGTTLTVTTDQSMNGDLYRAVFSNASGSSASESALLTVGTPAAITSASGTQFIAATAAQTFSVTASGAPVANLSLGGTVPAWLTLTDNGNGTATLSGNPPAASGGSYTVTIGADNGFGTADSQAFTVSVVESPTFTSPASTTFTVGATGSFQITTSPGTPAPATVSVSGDLPSGITFTAGVGTGELSGTPAPGSGGTYSLVLTASNGDAPDTVQAFTLTVNEAPAVSLNPSSATVNAGNTVSFTASATGFPLPTVQWQVSGDDGATFTDVPGATATTYTFAAALTHDGNQYRARFSNAATATPVATTAATLTVGTSPSFSSAGTTTFTVGAGAASFAVTTSGIPDAALNVDGTLPSWSTFTDDGNGSGTLSGEPSVGDGGIYSFDLVAGNGFSPDAVQSFSLVVTEAPRLAATGSATFSTTGTGSAVVEATVGYPVATTLSVSGTLPSGVSFTDNGDGSATISGTPRAGGVYPLTVTATNGVGTDATQAFTLTVTQPAAVATSPSDATVVAGSSATFTAAATGYPTPTVQWQHSADGGATFADIVGATSAVLSFTAAQEQDGTLYRAVFTGTGSATTLPAKLTVGTPATITSSDRVSFSAGGGTQTVTLSASGIPVADLQLTGAPVWVAFTDNGDGTATLTATPPSTAGGQYTPTLSASNGFGSPASQVLTVDVTQSSLISSANVVTFPVGVVGSFAVTTAGGHPAADSVTMSGALPLGVDFVDNGDGTATLDGTPQLGTGGQYPLTFTASNGEAPDTTQSFTLTVTEAPSLTSTDAASFMLGVHGTFTVTTDGGYPGVPSFALSGTLPAGLTFVDNGDGTGTISGTATDPAGSTATVTIAASNTAATSAPQAVTVSVVDATAAGLPAFAPFGDGVLQGVPAQLTPGQTLTVSGSGFAPGVPVTVGIYSTPVVLATVAADSAGGFTATVTIPSTFRGAHTLVAAGWSPTGSVHYLTASANVVSPAGLASTGVADVAPGSVGGLLLLVFGFVLLALVWLGRSRRQQRRV